MSKGRRREGTRLASELSSARCKGGGCARLGMEGNQYATGRKTAGGGEGRDFVTPKFREIVTSQVRFS